LQHHTPSSGRPEATAGLSSRRNLPDVPSGHGRTGAVDERIHVNGV
jgi:hypothetical protein